MAVQAVAGVVKADFTSSAAATANVLAEHEFRTSPGIAPLQDIIKKTIPSGRRKTEESVDSPVRVLVIKSTVFSKCGRSDSVLRRDLASTTPGFRLHSPTSAT
jgi:hypothetical protein